MAYRQLFAVACAVLGFVALPACGGGPGSAAGVETDDTAPENDDAPPYGASGDRAPSNDDTPPRAKDRPPSNPDRPPGGSPSPGDGDGGSSDSDAQASCQALCADIPDLNECSTAGIEGAVASICRTNCVLSEEDAACDAQLSDALDCLAQLGEFCTGNPPTAADAAQCSDEFEAADTCEDMNSVPDDDDDDPPPPPVANCTLAGGCQCATACQVCTCAGGTTAQCSAACM